MPIDSSLFGRSSAPITRNWSSADTLLYALGVGAGQSNPFDELSFTTENSTGVAQQVLPTYTNLAVGNDISLLGDDVDFTKLLHAEQSFSLVRPLPVAGELEATSTIAGVFDKGSGALVIIETAGRDASGEVVATTHTSVFVRGAGGFGTQSGSPAAEWKLPAREPDHVVTYSTRADQALLYRLTGDRNPLHTDPALAKRAGFERPILHGMCTYGYTGRALLHAVAAGDPNRFLAMSGRFTTPIVPGQTITVSIWVDGSAVSFRTTDASGNTVIDRGSATITP